jgi:hypothetical protein
LIVPDGNSEQTRIVAEQVADSAITRFAALQKLGQQQEQSLPPFVKWFSIAIGGLGSAALVGLGIWLVTSVSNMSTTLARMDERQISSAENLADRFEKIDERLSRLEQSQGGL